jgi:hypothetical protein
MIGPAGFMAGPKVEPACDEREFDALDVAQDVLNKMARAHKRGSGCRLTADEIHALSVTMIGQWWGQPDPRDEVKAISSSATKPLTRCAAGRDGECGHAQCPQLRDSEPAKSSRHCPLDNHNNEED